MSFQEVSMWRVVCDFPDCTRSPQDDGDYWAWADKDQAAMATEDDLLSWVCTDDERHYCPDHWKWSDNDEDRIPLTAVPSGNPETTP